MNLGAPYKAVSQTLNLRPKAPDPTLTWQGTLEYEATELAHYVATVLKGNPKALEPLFVSDEHAVARAWPWCELVDT